MEGIGWVNGGCVCEKGDGADDSAREWKDEEEMGSGKGCIQEWGREKGNDGREATIRKLGINNYLLTIFDIRKL